MTKHLATHGSVVYRSESNELINFIQKIGFKALLGWHYLVLFSPLLVGSATEMEDVFFDRQLLLYTTLAITFGALLLMERYLFKSANWTKIISSPIVMVGVGVLACIATVLSGYYLHINNVAKVLCVVLLGFSEALIMFVWLHFFLMLAISHPFRSLALDMIVGGLIAFLVISLVEPANLITAAVLPLAASVSMLLHGRAYRQASDYSEDMRSEKSVWSLYKHAPKRYGVKRLLPTSIYAITFGLIQGAFIANGVMLLLANNPLVFIGIVIAGFIIFFIPERPCTHADIDTVHRWSMFLFVLGIVLLSVTSVFVMVGADVQWKGVALVIGEIVLLAGFNLFDFGGLIQGVSLVRRFGNGVTLFVDSGRFFVYVCMALGLLAGMACANSMDDIGASVVLFIVCGIAIVLIVATSLVPSFNQDGYDDLFAQVPLVAERWEDEIESQAEIDAFNFLCANCSVSRTCAVRPVLMSDFAERAKVQVYGFPKPDVEQEPAKASKQETQAQAEKSAQEGGSSKPSASRSARSGGDAKSKTSSSSSASSARSKRNDAPDSEGRAPWRDACREIVKMYGLSPREEEIFYLISKGRNAEFVQKELVISIHTAKTHIANIYHKLDVHSVQEMLTLIETFRDENENREA